MKLCDLHTHSVFSDGTYTPTELVEAAENMGLSAIVLSDHNTVDGLPEFISAAQGKNTEAIPGAEFSVDYGGTELHLLALFIKEKHFPTITALMDDFQTRKAQSNYDLICALNNAGYDLCFEKIRNATPSGKFNRAHIAAELTQKGYVSSIKEAFSTLLAPKHGYYKEPKRPTVWEMLELIKSIGAVPILAHPFLNLEGDRLRIFLPQAKENGLIGMECYYPLYNKSTTEKSLELASYFRLKPSGGSDFHGSNKPDIALGVGKGNLQIPYDWAIALKTAAE
ncbi:MAG: PHP domain-containing protein [Ruminococcaceae bacterium]|nr:PHP domain-containing protein [Oscillospiraceae bacterium]